MHISPVIKKKLLLTIVITICIFSAGAGNQVHRSFHPASPIAQRYLNENPQKAIVLAQRAIYQAKLEADTSSLILAYTIICRVQVNIDQVSASLYLDSALALCTNQLKPNIAIIQAQIAYLNSQGKLSELESIIDGDIKRAKRLKDNRLIVDLLLLSSENQRNTKQPHSALESAKKALAVSQFENDSETMAICHSTIGGIHFQQSRFAQSQEEYSIALQLFTNLSDTLNQIVTLRNISLVHRDLGEYEEALSFINKALRLAYQLNHPDEMGHAYNLLGSLYARIGKPAEALENYEQSLIIRKENDFLSSYASTLENIARIRSELGQFKEALNDLEQTLIIRKELNNAQQLGSTYNELGNLFAQQGNLADALKYYLNSLKIRQEANLQSDISRSLINIGVTYRQLNSHQNALKYFNQALSVTPDDTDPLGKSYIYIHIGNCLRDLGNPTEAIENYTKALELRKIIGNQILISQALRSLAVAYNETNEFSKAYQFLGQASEIAKNLNDENLIAELFNEKGNVLQHEGKLEEAIDLFEQAAILFGKRFDLDKRGLCLRKIGEIQVKLGQYGSAYDNLKLALTISEKANNKKLKELTLLALHGFYLKRGQSQEALSYYKQYITIRDSLASTNQRENIWQASLDVELNKKVEEIRLIETEVESLRTKVQLREVQLRQQKLIKNFLGISSVFILIIAIGSLYGYMVIRKKNLRINEANEMLTQSENELKKMVHTKDKLFSIIAHDLRSPFTALVGLTEILSDKSGELKPDELNEHSRLIHESSGKLLKLIENLLEWSRSQTNNIALASKAINLHALTNEAISALALQANAKNILLENLIPKSITIYADFDTMSTVIRNLTSNAIKFTGKGGFVRLIGRAEGGFVVLEIKDNGVGISPENQAKLFKLDQSFSTKGTGQEVGTGLGLIVCKEFVEKNNGFISVSSQHGEGTTFIIRLPNVIENVI